jgi:hypothetical protein
MRKMSISRRTKMMMSGQAVVAKVWSTNIRINSSNKLNQITSMEITLMVSKTKVLSSAATSNYMKSQEQKMSSFQPLVAPALLSSTNTLNRVWKCPKKDHTLNRLALEMKFALTNT